MNVKFTSIKENDVASCGYSVSGELQIVRITRKTTAGKITALKKDSVVLDGTEYKCTPDAKQGMKLGISITAYQDQDGTILFWEKQSSSQSGESYGVILDAAMESKAIDGSSLLLKIWTPQNTQQIFNITQSITVNGKKMDVTKDLLNLFISAKEQLVRYSAKEDTLRSITLARAGSDFEELTGGFTNYRYKIQQRGFEIPGIYASNFMLRDDTVVFSLVKENNAFSDKKSQVTTPAYFAHDHYYTIRAYDKDEQGRCKAIVVMSSASDTFKPSSEMFLCTDVFTGLNEKDEIVTFVKGYFRGEEREMAVWEGFTTPFEVGGVYIVTTRENKEIGIAQLVDSVYSSADLSLSSLGGVRVACLGTVTGAGGGVCEVTANGQANSFVVSAANVYRINAETKKASLATPDSITKGSRVFINQDDFYVRDVFIIE